MILGSEACGPLLEAFSNQASTASVAICLRIREVAKIDTRGPRLLSPHPSGEKIRHNWTWKTGGGVLGLLVENLLDGRRAVHIDPLLST